MKALVAGGGGFIGGHLAESLLALGYDVVVADIKPLDEWYQIHPFADNQDELDLSELANCRWVTEDVDEVYMLAADMGGMGFIENNKLACMMSVLPSTHMLLASAENEVGRYFYSSSACVYAADKQVDPKVTALKESDAYPAQAEDGYGWEKLFTERMCRHFTEDANLVTRVARFHNVYGPYGTYDGGREKAPAAICRKVIEAKLTGDYHIDIWGDGKQTRSFMYIDDCVEGILRIMDCDSGDPLNLGSSELVSINQLVTMVESIAGVTLERTYDLTAPQGVRGRNSDNTLLEETVGWVPSVSLYDGLTETYDWIYGEMTR
jgi:nucleoside-diphosphate-sugar epimerase